MFPVLCYCSEIWGYQYWHNVERILIVFVNFFLDDPDDHIKRSVLTNFVIFSPIWMNKTGIVDQQKLKIFYLEMVLGMPGSI